MRKRGNPSGVIVHSRKIQTTSWYPVYSVTKQARYAKKLNTISINLCFHSDSARNISNI